MPEPFSAEFLANGGELTSQTPERTLTAKQAVANQERQRLEGLFDQDQALSLIKTLSEKDLRIIKGGGKIERIFELISHHELRGRETEKQTKIRERLNKLLTDQSLIKLLVPDQSGIPDNITVIFDENGNLVITKIIESKISRSAAAHSRNKQQPERTIRTLRATIDFFNKVNSNPDASIEDLYPNKKLKQKRIDKLNTLIKDIRSVGLTSGENVTLAQNLEYETIIPKESVEPGEKILVRNVKGTKIPVYLTQSVLDINDLEKITNKKSKYSVAKK